MKNIGKNRLARLLLIPGLLLLSCCDKEVESPPNFEPNRDLDRDKKIDAHFDARSWSVEVQNSGDENIFVGKHFFYTSFNSECGTIQGGSVRGIMGAYEIYSLMIAKDKRIFELNDEYKNIAGEYTCKLYYVDSLTEMPKELKFSFNTKGEDEEE